MSGSSSPPVQAQATLSQFAAKVLDQLSLSAWFPAFLFASTLTLLIQFRSQESVSLKMALDAITDDWKQFLLLALPALILATVLTQAFSYGAIRVCEGYWNRILPFGWLRSPMIRWQRRKLRRLVNRREAAAQHAFAAVRGQLLQTYSCALVSALEVQAVGGTVPRLEGEDARIYGLTSWRATCKPWDLARVDRFDREREDYPTRAGRLMPTKLGNVQRAYEDGLKNAGDDLIGFAMNKRELAPPMVQMQHDHFRQRLDMYCTLVFVSLTCAGLAVALLAKQVPNSSPWTIVVIAAGFAALSIACYASAVAAARGYGATLRVMDAAAGNALSDGGPH